jgi:DNA primase
VQPLRFSPDLLASLRERVPLSEIVGRAVTWDRRKSQPGKGDHWACCPFHQEKSPSFHVDDRKGYFHCFGCHASGDHLSFLTEHDGLDFVEAVKALAALAGVVLEDEPRAESAERRRREAADALEAAAALYAETLWSPAGRAARDYAAGRGFGEETLRRFGFGLAPSTRGFLSRALAAKGIAAAELERVGLAVRRDDGALHDRFRGRLMVPIHDGRGRIVGFGGRTIEGRDPKYLNSPETALFDKGRLLFNAHRARGAAHRTGRLVIVEGYLDAVGLAVAGIEETVASLGTALTEDQIRLAWSLADEPVLCFDGDAAGRAAADRAIDRILPLLAPGKSFSLLALPDGRDPDDVVREGGRAAFEALAGHLTPLVDAVFRREVARGADTPERLAALETRLDGLAAGIPDERVARLYKSAFRERLFDLRRVKSAPQKRPTGAGRSPLAPPAAENRALLDLERLALGLLLLRPQFIAAFAERLGGATFLSEAHAGFAALLVEAQAATGAESTEALLAALPESSRLPLAEVWGEAGNPVGRRLLERFSILECDPDDAFLARCMTLFLNRLELRAEVAELADEPRRLARTGGAGDGRLLSLSAAVNARRTALADAERALADEAAVLRRRRIGAAASAPKLS